MRNDHSRSGYFVTGKLFAAVRFSVLALCVLCVLRSDSLAQDFKQVHSGVEYAQVEHKIGNDPMKINLLRLDLRKVRLDVHHALDKAIGLETTTSIAKRKGAVAAINAGFFRLDKSEFAGEAASSLMIDGNLWSEGKQDRVLLEIDNRGKDTSAYIHRFNVWPWFVVMNSHHFYSLSGVNRPRKANEVVLYTPAFGPSTLTTEEGTEVVLTDCKRIGSKKNFWNRCAGLEIREGTKNGTIPSGGVVISMTSGEFPEKRKILDGVKFYQSNRKKRLSLGYYDKFSFRGLEFSPTRETDVVAGVPQLIKEGKIEITWQDEKASNSFVETRHPRTAVAKLKDGKFLMMTVDGRQPGVSVGMSLHELAEYLLSLGAVDAMNLDGGGSTTMYLDGRVVNTPSDKGGERKIGDAIVVTLRKK